MQHNVAFESTDSKVRPNLRNGPLHLTPLTPWQSTQAALSCFRAYARSLWLARRVLAPLLRARLLLASACEWACPHPKGFWSIPKESGHCVRVPSFRDDSSWARGRPNMTLHKRPSPSACGCRSKHYKRSTYPDRQSAFCSYCIDASSQAKGFQAIPAFPYHRGGFISLGRALC